MPAADVVEAGYASVAELVLLGAAAAVPRAICSLSRWPRPEASKRVAAVVLDLDWRTWSYSNPREEVHLFASVLRFRCVGKRQDQG